MEVVRDGIGARPLLPFPLLPSLFTKKNQPIRKSSDFAPEFSATVRGCWLAVGPQS